MASLQERVNNRKFYERVRRNGKWVTIDTRTGKVVDKATRLKHKSENKKKWIQRGKNREEDVKKWLKQNVAERMFDSDEDDPNHPVKGGKLTQRQARLNYEKEIANRDTGEDDAEMTAKDQARALKISKKRDLVNMKPLPEKPKSEKLKVNKKDNESSSSNKTLGTETEKQFIERTKNSPAAKAFGNSPEANKRRWAARQNYLRFLEKRKKKNKK
tara:strand:- start:145 stop:789 length:645 start_codon:yes stop_codon:yes gene_type:complete